MLSRSDIITKATHTAALCDRFHVEPVTVALSTDGVLVMLPIEVLRVAFKGRAAEVRRDIGRTVYTLDIEGVRFQANVWNSNDAPASTEVL